VKKSHFRKGCASACCVTSLAQRWIKGNDACMLKFLALFMCVPLPNSETLFKKISSSNCKQSKI
jgi:hypothetical protein